MCVCVCECVNVCVSPNDVSISMRNSSPHVISHIATIISSYPYFVVLPASYVCCTYARVCARGGIVTITCDGRQYTASKTPTNEGVDENR